ncbi:hypothetical protein HK105_201494 [Polyrhizophydium stewartii]|uniref:Kinesin-associated protein 3 n=1 Tax=Polyrhizophydium stewartii TaxID=2732419 RepID=A0ABR4NGR9_9FUNG
MGGSQDDVESFQVRKKIVPGAIDVHPTESAIIVHYTMQASIIGENGQPVAGDKKAGQKIIRVKALHPNSSISSLAQEVIEKCKLIHPSRFGEVEQVLYYLQQRQSTEGDSDRVWLRKQLEEVRKSDDSDREGVDLLPVQDEPSTMANIEAYIEGLYEEIAEKVKSTRNILQLAKIPENMAALIENESLMSALSRVLREDGRKSMELVTNIIYIFFCFSNFSEFHPVVTANKLGDMCLRITDQELTRFDLWVQDLRKLETRVAQTPNDKSLVAQLDQEHRKFQNMLRKQDQLLFVSFHLLLNLAEDLSIEVKMIKRDIVKYLINMLDRKTPELLILVVTFLKKLSVFRENKDEMLKGLQSVTLRLLLNLSHDSGFRLLLVREGYLQKLANMLTRRSFLMVTLQLMYQLSLDDKGRSSPVFGECIPQIIRMILEYKGERVNGEIMALSINMATVHRNAQIISDDNGIKFLMRRAIKTRDPLMFKMLRNVSQHDDEAIKMKFLDFIDDMMHLMFKSMSNTDIVVEILGILANLTIAEFDFGKLATTYDLLFFIGNTITASVSEAQAKARHPGRGPGGPAGASSVGRSADLSSATAASGGAGMAGSAKLDGIAEDDDVLLEVINLLGTMALDENIAPMVASTNLLQLLIQVMIAKEEDDEIILQVCFCIYQFLLHDATKKILIGQTDIVGYLIDLLYDRNVEIRKMCDASLSIIGEIDEEWERKLRQQKFAWHNSEWIAIMTQVPESPGSMLEESSILYSKSRSIGAAVSHQDSLAYRGTLTPGMYDDDSDDEDGYRNGIGGSNAILDGPGF